MGEVWEKVVTVLMTAQSQSRQMLWRRCAVLWMSLTGGLCPTLGSQGNFTKEGVPELSSKNDRTPPARMLWVGPGKSTASGRTWIVRRPDVLRKLEKGWVSGIENEERVMWGLVWWSRLEHELLRATLNFILRVIESHRNIWSRRKIELKKI